jgi:hypothetical protein
MNKIFRLVYISEAHHEVCYTDLENILFSARNRNSKLDITGILIHKDDFFIQLLEGSESHVKEVLSLIIKDRRHKHLRVIKEWTSETPRYFEKWSMSFVDGDLEEKTHPFIQQIFSDIMLIDVPNEAQLQNFFISISDHDIQLK